MSNKRDFDDTAQRAFDELTRSCRSICSRSKTLADLAGRVDPLGSLATRTRTASDCFEAALKVLVPPADYKLSLQPVAGDSGPSRSMVVRCVDQLLGNLGSTLGRKLSSEEKKDLRRGLTGHSWAVPIPELITFLCGQEKTGVLEVTSLTETFAIIFERGELVHASSDNTPAGQRLGELLVKMGALEERKLLEFLRRYASSAGRLGEALEKEELVSRDAMREALEAQVRGLFNRLYAAEGASYTFYLIEKLEENPHVRMNAIHLLMESAQAFDEALHVQAENAKSTPSADQGELAKLPDLPHMGS